MAALEGLGQATILLGTSEFDHKTRQELQTMGFPEDHYFCIPHSYTQLADTPFNALLDQLVLDIATLVGTPA
jgi:hypothetical protein